METRDIENVTILFYKFSKYITLSKYNPILKILVKVS